MVLAVCFRELQHSLSLYAALIIIPGTLSLHADTAFAGSESVHTEAGIELGENLGPDPSLQNHRVQKSARNKRLQEDDYREDGHSVLHNVLLYLPNRVFDILDIVRLRVRIGPGVALGAQVTKPVRVHLGAHTSIWAGLPGPRQKATIPLPIGAQSSAKAALSVLDLEVGGDTGPEHSPTEVALETQLALIGFDIGIDPVEIADLLTGIFFIDLRDDDL